MLRTSLFTFFQSRAYPRLSFLIIAFCIALASGSARATGLTELSVVDVRRNIPLSDSEPVYKDFYINGGEENGFKKNQILTLVRKVSVKDSSGSQTIGDMKIPVGQLKILAIFPKVTVARELKLFTRAEYPMLEQSGIMIGDLLDLKNPITERAQTRPPAPAPAPAPEVVKPETNEEINAEITASGSI